MKKLKLLSLLLFCCLLPISCAWPNLSGEDNDLLDPVLELKPFFTDGCTMFVDGPRDQPKLWRNCCVEHDLRFWFGGSSEDREETDLRLKACVEKVAGAYWANLIYYGVKTGQLSSIKSKTHWNWGWTYKRPYEDLSVEEINYVKSELTQMTVPEVDIAEFIKTNFP